MSSPIRSPRGETIVWLERLAASVPDRRAFAFTALAAGLQEREDSGATSFVHGRVWARTLATYPAC